MKADVSRIFVLAVSVVALVGSAAAQGLPQARYDLDAIALPDAPAPVGALADLGTVWGLDVEGGFAYVTDFGGHLHVVDVSDPTNPVRRGTAVTPWWAQILSRP